MRIGSFRNPIIILTTLVLLISILNLGFSNYHLKSLLNSVEKTEEIMLNLKNRLVLNETADSRCFRSENVGRVYCGLELNDWVRDKVSFYAEQSRTNLEVEIFKLNQINVLFFGNELNPTIQEYTNHANAWIDYLERLEGCSDYSCFYSQYQKPNSISSTFKVAEIEFRSVIPVLDLFQSENRIDLIFRD